MINLDEAKKALEYQAISDLGMCHTLLAVRETAKPISNAEILKDFYLNVLKKSWNIRTSGNWVGYLKHLDPPNTALGCEQRCNEWKTIIAYLMSQ